MIIYSPHLKMTRHLINMSLPVTRIKLDFTQGCLFSIFSTRFFFQVSPHVSRDTLTLTKFQKFAWTLTKLKLEMPLKDLAFRFGPFRQYLEFFSTWMVALDIRLSPSVSWPDREYMWSTMPQCFQKSFLEKSNCYY